MIFVTVNGHLKNICNGIFCPHLSVRRFARCDVTATISCDKLHSKYFFVRFLYIQFHFYSHHSISLSRRHFYLSLKIHARRDPFGACYER